MELDQFYWHSYGLSKEFGDLLSSKKHVIDPLIQLISVFQEQQWIGIMKKRKMDLHILFGS